MPNAGGRYGSRLIVCLALLLTGCQVAAGPTVSVPATSATNAPRPLTPFKWLFGFRIQAGATAPIVIAKDLGYYADEGLDLSWDIAADQTSIRLIAAGQYQAGSVSSPGTLIDMVHEGLPLKSIGLMTQQGSRTFAVRKDSGIKRPKDFEGKTVGYKTSIWPEYLAMLTYDHVDRSKIKEIEVGLSSIELKDGTVDVLPVSRGNEPVTLRTVLNLDIDLIEPSDYGFPPLGTELIVNTDYAKSNPDQVLGFLKATLKGLDYYVNNKQQSLDIIQRYATKEVTPAVNASLYDNSVPDMVYGQAKTLGLGYQTPEQWQGQINVLGDLQVTQAKPRVEEVIDNQFLEKAVKDGKLVWP
jgi:putative hydroxymethylpyrimidine transport system substrate-binding protein